MGRVTGRYGFSVVSSDPVLRLNGRIRCVPSVISARSGRPVVDSQPKGSGNGHGGAVESMDFA